MQQSTRHGSIAVALCQPIAGAVLGFGMAGPLGALAGFASGGVVGHGYYHIGRPVLQVYHESMPATAE